MSDEVASPCNDVCTIDQESGLCRGCFRTLAEISRWMACSHADKLALLEALVRRKTAAAQAKSY